MGNNQDKTKNYDKMNDSTIDDHNDIIELQNVNSILKIPFNFTRKEIIKSRIIIYDDAKLKLTILFVSIVILTKITYKKLIEVSDKMSYFFLSEEMEPIYYISLYFDNRENKNNSKLETDKLNIV